MSEPDLPQLRVARSDAKVKIAEQIRKGREIQNAAGQAWNGPNYKEQFAQAGSDREKWAKYTIELLRRLFTHPSITDEFGDWHYRPATFGLPVEDFNQWMQDKITRLESIEERLELIPTMGTEATGSGNLPTPSSRDIFLVHGHDEAAKHEVARFLEQLGLRPIILHEQPDKGQTIIEKFEHHSDVGFAVVLLTPDDMGHPKDEPAKAKPRARQNVVLELGYFIGLLGRTKVCPLLKGGIEIPTDYSGVLYMNMDDAGAWRLKLAREIKESGIEVDLNKLT